MIWVSIAAAPAAITAAASTVAAAIAGRRTAPRGSTIAIVTRRPARARLAAAGYRIGPSEIENCLVKHPAVANAAVVPKPDAERGALVKAYVVLAPGFVGDAALITTLQQHVRGQLAPYEYPKEIEFIDALPMTTTGKVQRRVLRLLEEERFKLSL